MKRYELYGGATGVNWLDVTTGTHVTSDHLCPDLLRYEQIGVADGWRGRFVRGFFWLLRAWPVGG